MSKSETIENQMNEMQSSDDPNLDSTQASESSNPRTSRKIPVEILGTPADDTAAEDVVAEDVVAEDAVADDLNAEIAQAEAPNPELLVTDEPTQPESGQPAEAEVAKREPAEAAEAVQSEPAEEAKAEAVKPAETEPVKSSQVEEAKPAQAADVEPALVEVAKPHKAPELKPKKISATDRRPAGQPRFIDLELSQSVQQAIEQTGYTEPTPIQAEIIPGMLAGRDIVAQSQTGTGKTAAFAMPILSRLKNIQSRKPQVLVLAPTRELAIQVSRSFETYGACLDGFSVTAIYGGQSYDPQLRQLRKGVNVVVGTPGRVIDHVKRGTLDLGEINCLVLDEADEMLNMGFLEDVEFVLEHTPDRRQIALFSATMPQPIRNIADRYLDNPIKVTIKKKTMTADSIRQRAVFVSPRDKIDVLIKFMEAEDSDGVIVFTRTRETTTRVAEQLSKAGLSAVALNGDMPQRSREQTIERLKSGRLDILVATDVAARGLDVTRISHVFNFDLPEGSESYIHRVGRTGRAGRPGEAIIFLSRNQSGKLRLIERATKQPIEVVEPPKAKQINEMRIKRYKEQLAATIANEDLTLFSKLVGEFAEESKQPFEVIAAAAVLIGQQGRDFMMQDRPARKERERGDRKDRAERTERGGGRRRFSEDPEHGKTRYRIAVGKRDGVKPGNIVGAVANEAGIDGEDIGPIRIHESYSTVDLPKDMPRDVFELLQTTRVSGRELRLKAETADREFRSEYRGNSRPKSNRSNSNRSVGERSGSDRSGSDRSGSDRSGSRRTKRRAGDVVPSDRTRSEKPSSGKPARAKTRTKVFGKGKPGFAKRNKR